MTQVLGSLFLHIRNNVSENGSSLFGERLYQHVAPSSQEYESFKDFQRNTFYSALLQPIYPFEYKAKNKQEKVILKVLSDSLKKSNEVVKFVTGVLPYVTQSIELASIITSLPEDASLSQELKLKLGWHLREAGHRWDTIFLLALS